MLRQRTVLVLLVFISCGMVVTANGQVTRGARERQQDRVERRTERQLNRIDRGFYFNDAAWAEIQPWFNKYQFGPIVEVPANARVEARYGFNDVDKNDDWYFDHYDPGFGVVYPAQADVTGTFGAQYFDSNGDGIYDVYYNVYDKDSDGIFDDQEEFRFGNVNTQAEPQDNATFSRFQDSRAAEITGEVIAIKKATVRSDEHVLIHVRTSDGREIPVDVGHASHLKVRISVGDRVAVSGYMVTMGDRDLLISDRVEVNNERVDVQRTSEPMTGVIVETRNVTLHDQEHQLVVLDVKGNHRLVDVGPVANLEFEFKPKTQLTVYGVPVQVNEGQMLMASRIQYNDKTLPVIRRAARR